jgi:hypothetical protein
MGVRGRGFSVVRDGGKGEGWGILFCFLRPFDVHKIQGALCYRKSAALTIKFMQERY